MSNFTFIAMRKTIDILLYLTFCALVGTALGMELFHKAGRELHTVLGIVLVVLVAIHIVLNWKWVVDVLFKGKRGAAILGILIGIAVAVAFMFLLPERGARYQHQGPRSLVNFPFLTIISSRS